MNRKITKIETIQELPTKKRVAAYVRVSCNKEEMLHSFAAQISHYSGHIQHQNRWIYAGVYADEAITGTKDSRPEFQRLIADCRKRKIDLVLTKSISRFARNTVTLLETVRELKTLGIDIFFEEQNIHTLSAEGELLLTILASYAQEESRSVSENCKWRIQDDMKKGKTVGFFGMYGYDYKDGKITVNEEQAAVVQQMFDWYIGGLGVTAIAQRLNELKIPACKGGKWRPNRVNDIIVNEKLTGDALLQKKYSTDHLTKKQKRNRGEMPRYYAERTHTAIINIEVFEMAKRIRRERAERFNTGDTSKNTYRFSGKIICGNCGKKYKRKKGVCKFYWQCSTYLQEGKSYCSAQQIPEDILQEIVDIDFEQIRVPKPNDIIIVTPNGTEVERHWKYKSRRESWTDEMKSAARKKQRRDASMTNVRIIPATAPVVSAYNSSVTAKRRVAAYARVSTDKDEQLTSYEAQVSYYTEYIKSRADWEFITVYTDEGISAVNTKRREGFKLMVADALMGKIDLIVTKSVSRFARNTVDSLTTIRQLKEKGVECYFEKEAIWTFDGKGELLLTIMSSLAQEESRSISENVTWGQRKRMQDGKVSLPYKHFLGYEKGEDGLPKIVPAEAEIVRLIFKLFMEGKTFSAIAKLLGDYGILSPAGKETWQTAVVRSILTNEKYKGHALMQKTYCEDFLTKKMVRNTGQIQQYYVENSHPAIIEPDEFDAVQLEIERRRSFGKPTSCTSIFASKIICAECGGWYGSKVWQSNTKYRRTIWRCNDKYKRQNKSGNGCGSPHVTEEEIKDKFLTAFNALMNNRDGLIEDCRLAQTVLYDIAAIEAELTELLQEIEFVTELSRKAIYENARTAVNQSDWNEHNNSYLERHRRATERINELETQKMERLGKSKIFDRFICDIKKRPLVIIEFDEKLWLAVINRVTICKDGAMVFKFRNDTEITT